MSTFKSPAPLADHHVLDDFYSGVASLDSWLKNKARKNEVSRASRTYVLCDETQLVIGYYALAAGAVSMLLVPGKLKRNMPEPIPVMILGRLAIDKSHQGKGLGDAMLRDAILRTLQAVEIAGIKALVVHAISEKAKQYYLSRSFIPSPQNPMTLFLPLASLQF